MGLRGRGKEGQVSLGVWCRILDPKPPIAARTSPGMSRECAETVACAANPESKTLNRKSQLFLVP